MRRNKAFTLAETMITLTIIGIIAALTIPTLLNNINDNWSLNKWKQSYSEISRATILLNTQYGSIDFTSNDTMRNDYEKVMSFTKKDTWNNLAAPKYLYYKNQSQQGWDSSTDTTPSARLSNGVVVEFTTYGDSGGGVCTTPIGNLTEICGHIRSDINGKKAPNMVGEDLFVTWIVKKNNNYYAFPIGSHGDNISCVAGSNDWTTCDGCAAYALSHDKMPE